MVSAQCQILTLAGHDCCKTVDRAQGSEWVDGILSTGRLHGVGFLKDRRCVNVALTRFKARLIVLLNVRCGIANPFWTALHRFLSYLGAVVHVGNIDGGAYQIEGAVAAVVRKAELRGVITVQQVRAAVKLENLKSIFDVYQLDVVGPLNSCALHGVLLCAGSCLPNLFARRPDPSCCCACSSLPRADFLA